MNPKPSEAFEPFASNFRPSQDLTDAAACSTFFCFYRLSLLSRKDRPTAPTIKRSLSPPVDRARLAITGPYTVFGNT